MSENELDVIGVGNAIVDVIAKTDDAFLARLAIVKGGMELIDEARAHKIYAAMAAGVEISGGSAANTIASLASLGGKGGFAGKVANDALGEIFAHDLKAMGVEYKTAPLSGGPSTARCLVNVTPDAQRSMSTYLGAASHLSPDDIDAGQIARAAITYFEGYLFEEPTAREAFIRACEIARKSGRRAAVTLSDTGCVTRQREAFLAFIGGHIDIVVANEDEAKTLFASDDMAAISESARALCPLTVVTLSEKGSVLIPRGGDSVEVQAIKPTALVDTTGAGDAYAAGLLFGLARRFDLARAGALGSLSASEIISHFGARPQTPLKALAEGAKLL